MKIFVLAVLAICVALIVLASVVGSWVPAAVAAYLFAVIVVVAFMRGASAGHSTDNQ